MINDDDDLEMQSQSKSLVVNDPEKLLKNDNSSDIESETDSEDKNKFLDININSYVYHKFIIKSINDDDDKIYLVATGVQKCLIPYLHEKELNKHLQFDYRINNEADTSDIIKERKTKTVKVISNKENKNDSSEFKIATVTTNAMKLPLNVNMILNHFPFRLYKASVKIELTSREVDKEDKSHITLRPTFVYPVKNNYENLIRINNTDRKALGKNPDYNNLFDIMDKTKKFDILSPIPFIYGTVQKKDKQNTDNHVEYIPIIEIGFYLYEPVLEAFFNMIAPLFMILLLMTSTVLINMDETSYLGIMCGIILAVVFVMKNIRRPSSRSKFTTTDMYIILFLLGLSICSISVAHPHLKVIGVSLAWISNVVPLIGCYRYNLITNKIIKNLNKYNEVIQNPDLHAKSKEDIIIDDLVNVPSKNEAFGFIYE
jgi:hypothetical protein